MFGPNRDENTPLVGSVVRSHCVKGSVFFSNVLVQQFRMPRTSEGGSLFAKRQLPGCGVMLRFWGMGGSMIRTVMLMAFFALH
jgi:hypothetical protein